MCERESVCASASVCVCVCVHERERELVRACVSVSPVRAKFMGRVGVGQ